jgi:hypothetical protein
MYLEKMKSDTRLSPSPRVLYRDHAIPAYTSAIRLLRLDECYYADLSNNSLPTSFRCSFEVHDLGTAPEFVALSYTWGSDTAFNNGILSVHGRDWPLRDNLRDALLHIWDIRGRENDDSIREHEQPDRQIPLVPCCNGRSRRQVRTSNPHGTYRGQSKVPHIDSIRKTVNELSKI